MAEETSSLRQAIDRIMDWPAGGTGGAVNPPGRTPALSTGIIPRSDVVKPGTTSVLENVVPEAVSDPFAEELATLQASNAELAAQIGDTAATIAPTTLGAGKPQLTYADQLRGDLALSGITGSLADTIVADSLSKGGYTVETMFDPNSNMALNPEIVARPANYATTTTATGPTALGQDLNAPIGSGYTPMSSSGSLRNPGPKAPWQESAQYWKDLAAQTKK